MQVIGFGDIFSPVTKLTSIRFILFIVVSLEHMDVNTTFQHGYLEEEIYLK